MKAMIFAAGLGTRLKLLTNNIPKALVPYKNKPLLQIVIEHVSKFGFDDIIINVHHFADKVIKFLDDNDNFNLKISISDESDLLLETGGGLFKAKDFFDDNPFLVYNVDILSTINLKNLYNYHIENKSFVTLAVQNRNSDKKLYFNDNKELCFWKNEKTGKIKPAKKCLSIPKPFAFSGIHIINPKIFNYMQSGVYSIIDTYLKVAKKEKIIYFDHSNDEWKDMGKPENFETS